MEAYTGAAMMACTPYVNSQGSLYEIFDPFCKTIPLLVDNSTLANSFARDVRVVANRRVDWKETDKEHVFKADLPGLKKEEIRVTVEGRTLSISAQRSKEEVQKTDTWHRAERSTGRFMRKIKMPENADLDDVTAKQVDGVLTVIVAKLQSQGFQPRSIDIGTSGGDEKSGQAPPPAVHGSS